MSTTLEYLPIWRVRDLSFAAKMTWLAFHAGIPVPDTACATTYPRWVSRTYPRKPA